MNDLIRKEDVLKKLHDVKEQISNGTRPLNYGTLLELIHDIRYMGKVDLLSSACEASIPAVYNLLCDTNVKFIKILHTNKNTEAIVKYIDGHFEEKVLSGVEFDAFVESLFLLYDMDFTNDSVVSRILPYEENRNVKVTLYNLAKVTLYNLTWVYGKSSNALAKAITIRKLWEEHE